MMELATCKENIRSCSTNKTIPPKSRSHCHAHSLSLSVKEATKSIKILGDTMGTAGKLIILIKYSPKREKLLGDMKEQVEFVESTDYTANAISKLSETRWTVRAGCFKRILDNYNKLMAICIVSKMKN